MQPLLWFTWTNTSDTNSCLGYIRMWFVLMLLKREVSLIAIYSLGLLRQPQVSVVLCTGSNTHSHPHYTVQLKYRCVGPTTETVEIKSWLNWYFLVPPFFIYLNFISFLVPSIMLNTSLTALMWGKPFWRTFTDAVYSFVIIQQQKS